MDDLLDKAFYLALEICDAQEDGLGGHSLAHSMRVAFYCHTQGQKIVALLHAVVEKSTIDSKDLIDSGFPRDIVDAVIASIQEVGEPYLVFVQRIKQNPLSRVVEMNNILDILDHKVSNESASSDSKRYHEYIQGLHLLI